MKLLYEKETPFYEMANIRSKHTGLPMVIWIQPKIGNEKHWARIKVSKVYGDKVSDSLFIVTIENEPKVIGETGNILLQDISKVLDFVKLNKDLLLKYWNDDIDVADVLQQLKKI